MKTKTKTELKKIAQAALKREYGFQPTLKEVTLLEADGDGTYILFEINGHEYRLYKALSTGITTLSKKGNSIG